MRFSVALLFAGAASAVLVSRQNVPQCAITCITSANLNGCSATDNKCLCTNQAFINSTTTCIQTTCAASDIAAAEQFAQATCEAVGVTLTASSTASASGSGSGSGSSAASATATSTSTTSASSSTTSSSGAKTNSIPVLAVAALGLAAFAL